MRGPRLTPGSIAALAVATVLTVGCSPQEQPSRVTVAIAGDVHVEPPLDLMDPTYDRVFAPLRSADVAIVNFETALTDGGTAADKRFTFRAGEPDVERLSDLGIDVLTMANNHALDFGPDGLADTLAVRNRPTPRIIGVGRDVDDAFAPARIDVRGTTITVFAASLDDDPTADPTAQWAAGADSAGTAHVDSPDRLVESVREADPDGPVVVMLHWGVQQQTCAVDSQTTLARALVDAGADVVAGAHSHTVQGMGRLGDAFVAYGLGNFVWRWPTRGDADGGVLTLTLDDTRVVEADWIATSRTPETPAPQPVADAQDVLQDLPSDGCSTS